MCEHHDNGDACSKATGSAKRDFVYTLVLVLFIVAGYGCLWLAR